MSVSGITAVSLRKLTQEAKEYRYEGSTKGLPVDDLVHELLSACVKAAKMGSNSLDTVTSCWGKHVKVVEELRNRGLHVKTYYASNPNHFLIDWKERW